MRFTHRRNARGESEMNPQIVYGEESCRRIQYTIEHEDGLAKLHKAVIDHAQQIT